MGGNGIADYPITYVGVFDYYGLYKALEAWILANEYKIHYKKYGDSGGGGPGLREREFELSGVRTADEYHMWKVSFSVKVIDCADVNIDYPDGKTVLMTRGKLKINLTGDLVEDYRSVYDTKRLKKIQTFMKKYVKQTDTHMNHRKKINDPLRKLHQELKTMLHIDTSGVLHG